MEDKDLNYLFNNVPLYTKEIFEVFYEENNQYYLNENELIKLIIMESLQAKLQ